MSAISAQARTRVPAASFDDFVASRPDEESWELIDGQYVMQAQPTFNHQIMAGNLERLLNDALERSGASRIAVQNPTIDLSPAIVGHRYVPDLGVLDSADIEPERNIAQVCYLVAEIVSPSDRRALPGTRRSRMDIKTEAYQALASCEAILIFEQDRPELRLFVRRAGGWAEERFSSLECEMAIPGFDFRCSLSEVYARTSVTKHFGTRTQET